MYLWRNRDSAKGKKEQNNMLKVLREKIKEKSFPEFLDRHSSVLVRLDDVLALLDEHEKELRDLRNDFPSCEVCPNLLPNPALKCYNLRHKYPSQCPKDKWLKRFYQNNMNKYTLNLAKDWQQIDRALVQRQSLKYLGENEHIFLEWIRRSILKLGAEAGDKTPQKEHEK